MLLAIEAQQVLILRLVHLAVGGAAAEAEAARMVSEKIAATNAAGHAAMSGASTDKILRIYRRRVRANIKRLSRAR
jgi:hypothetical protein